MDIETTFMSNCTVIMSGLRVQSQNSYYIFHFYGILAKLDQHFVVRKPAFCGTFCITLSHNLTKFSSLVWNLSMKNAKKCLDWPDLKKNTYGLKTKPAFCGAVKKTLQTSVDFF